MSQLNFSLTPVSKKLSGKGRTVYRAVVQANGIVGEDELVKAIDARTRFGEPMARCFLTALSEELQAQILEGNRLNFGLFSLALAIRGSFENEDDEFDPERHSLVQTIFTQDELKRNLSKIVPQNTAASLHCTVLAVMDAVTKRRDAITGTNEVHISGKNIGIDVENPDEGVTLVDRSGRVVATAVVTSSDAQTIACSFPNPPSAGSYTLVVAARNGQRASLSPAIGRYENVRVN